MAVEDGFVRETFTLPREKARDRARDFLDRYPKAAYMSAAFFFAADNRHSAHAFFSSKIRVIFAGSSP